MSTRRRDDDTRDYDDAPRRPSRKKRRSNSQAGGGGAVLALVGLLLLGVAVAGGLWFRSRKIGTDTPTPPVNPTNPGGAGQVAAGGVGGQATPPVPPAGAKAELDALIAEVDRLDPNWRLDQLEAKRAVLPPNENSALVVIQTAALLPRPDGVTLDFVKQAGENRMTPQQQAGLNAWLKARSAALNRGRDLINLPRGRYTITYAKDFINTLLPDIQKPRNVAELFRNEAARRAETGNPGQLEEFRVIFNAGRSIGDEPIVISQLIRSMVVRQAIESLEQTLARTTATDEALALAQQMLTEETGYNALLTAMRGERAFQFGFYAGFDSGTISTADVANMQKMFNLPISLPADITAGSPALIAARIWNLRFINDRVEAAKKPIHEAYASEAQFSERMKQAPPAARFFDEMIKLNGLSGNLFFQREAVLRTGLVALAAERYRLKHGRWPQELKEIDAALVGKLPVDPYDGSPLRFRRLEDGLVIYAIGPNGRDDGGDLGDRSDKSPDFGLRLWDAEKRR